jgi:hypothetical protein
VAIEDVVAFLVRELNMPTISPGADQIIQETRLIFDRIQSRRAQSD